MKLGALAARLGGRLRGDPDVEITGVGEPQAAGPGMIVYAADARALRTAEAGGAGAPLAPAGLPGRPEAPPPPPRSAARMWDGARAGTSVPTASSATARVSARVRRCSRGRWWAATRSSGRTASSTRT